LSAIGLSPGGIWGIILGRLEKYVETQSAPGGLRVAMPPPDKLITKDRARKVLRRAGIPAAQIEEMLAQLPDPFDIESAQPVYARYGLSHEQLINRMGGSP
jgi:hypothetical protein